MNRVTNLGYLAFCALSCLLASVLHYSWGRFNGFVEVLPLLFVQFPSFSRSLGNGFEISMLFVLIP